MLIWFCLLCAGELLPAQTAETDRLLAAFRASRQPVEQRAILLELFRHAHSINRDTMDAYAPLVQQLCDSSSDPQVRALGALAWGDWYYRWGISDSALYFIRPALRQMNPERPEWRETWFRLKRAEVTYLGSHARYEEATEASFELLRVAEQYANPLFVALTQNTLASIAIARRKPEEGMEWVRRALATTETNNRNSEARAAALVNLAMLEVRQGHFSEAKKSADRGRILADQLGNLNIVAAAYRVIANACKGMGKYPEAEEALQLMISVRKRTGSPLIVMDEIMEMADLRARTGRLDEAIRLLRQNLDSPLPGAENIINTDPKLRFRVLQQLSGYYRQAGRSAEYQQTLEELLGAQDSFYRANSAAAMAELETRYDVQKKENTILQQKYDLQRKNFMVYGGLLLGILLAIAGWWRIRELRKRQRQELAQALESEKRAAEQAVREAGERERQRIAADLHDNLGVQASAILHNTERLQEGEGDTQRIAENLHDTAREMLRNLRETVWAMKSGQIPAQAIWLRMINFAQQMRGHYPAISIYTRGEAPAGWVLQPATALHLVMIIQEAVQNAVKHAAPREVWLDSVPGSEWEVCISDDGRGFDPRSLPAGDHHGLRHMQQRASEAGLGWALDSAAGKGTRITITVHWDAKPALDT